MKIDFGMLVLLFFFFLFMTIHAFAQNNKRGYDFGLLRQYDDLSFAKALEKRGWYDHAKYLPLGQASYGSFGGSYRTQFEYFNHQDFISDNTDGWWLNRFLLHTDWRLGRHWQFFGELVSSTVLSKADPSPVDRNELAINQAFIKYQKGAWTMMVGRENLTYGSRRLIAPREGPNVRHSFDGARLLWKKDQLTLESFYFEPLDVSPFVFDNSSLAGNERIYGVYNTFLSPSEKHNLDFYYLVQEQEAATYEIGTDQEKRHSLGMRYFGKWDNFSFDTEGLYQFGTFGSRDISAWTLSSKLNYAVSTTRGKVDFEFKSEIISGDRDPGDNTLNTFNALYPRGAYFGRVALFGPSNLIDVHPGVTYFFKKWFFHLDYLAIWRQSTADAIYGAGLTPSFPSINHDLFVGHQYGAVINCQLNVFMALELEANYVVPGAFLEHSNLYHHLLHAVFTAELKL